MASFMRVEEFEEIDSTHTYVLQDKEGKDVFVVAKRQTQGVTSKPDHKWYSDEGGLYLSLRISHRGLMRARHTAVSVIGNELSDMFSELFNINVNYEAPNDLYVKNRKIGGILVVRNNLTTIYSLGLNVNQSVFDDEIKDIATSVRLETNKEHSLDIVLDNVISYFNSKLDYYEKKPRREKPLLTKPYKRQRNNG